MLLAQGLEGVAEAGGFAEGLLGLGVRCGMIRDDGGHTLHRLLLAAAAAPSRAILGPRGTGRASARCGRPGNPA